MSNEIEIVGARTNNLQSVDVALPLHQATMVIGVSGSGKSSLLADTLATEANARMQRFLGVHQPHLSNEDVPAFVGPVPACIHFSQGAFRASRRTTVATSSGLLALLRFYFRKYAKPWAEDINDFVPAPSPSSYQGWIEKYYTGSLSIWTVVERWERTDGLHAARLLRSHGVKHATIRSETDSTARNERGREVDLDHFRPLSANVKHLIEAKVGQVELPSASSEISALLQQAFDIGKDVIVEFHQGEKLPEELHTERGILLDSTQHWIHPKVRLPFAPPSDALLSFNSPSNPKSGACPSCQGLGRVRTVAIPKLVIHPDRSLHEGALVLWTEKNYRYVNIQHETIEGLRNFRSFDPNKAWKHLNDAARQLILYGSGQEAISDIDPITHRKLSSPRPFPGFIPAILRRAEGSGPAARTLEALTSEARCSECNGTRWSRAARALRLGTWHLPVLLEKTFDELEHLATPKGKLERDLSGSIKGLANGLYKAAKAFVSAGLGHLSGERGMTTLSEGESRRSRLAAILHAQGQGLGLLLDEPARGLHEADVARLADALATLKRRHTLIINEHRLSLASIADHVLEIGPGAGEKGGKIVSKGSPKDVFTPNWYPPIERLHLPTTTHSPTLTVKGAQLHTLSNVTCRIPLGRLVCITGVSGSGKSSFIRGILLPALAQALPGKVEYEGFAWPDGVWKHVKGTETIDFVLALEPRTPSANRRSTVATLLEIAESLRQFFGNSPEARKVKLTAKDFGLNAGNGRCQTCLGLGEIEDAGRWISCPHCGGYCFGEEALGVRVKGLNIADVLGLPISELHNHPFEGLAKWRSLIEQLVALDLGYLSLGRRVDRLSGGEHQRLRVAQKLGIEKPVGLLLVLDEPSAGLHPQDVAQLLGVLDRVVGEGRNTVVLVEHNLDLIHASDWVIDFGPGGGPAGGKIIGQGTPEDIAKSDTPTGRALRKKPFKTTFLLGERATDRIAESPTVDSKATAQSGRQWLKRLLGEEASATELDPVDFEGLAVMFDSAVTARPYEIGGLDVEIARLLLDEPDDTFAQPERLAQLWLDVPKAQLRIHPLLEEIRVWGDQLPASIIRAAQLRLKRLGLESNEPFIGHNCLATLRATGERFQPSGATVPEYMRCIRDALGIGGGYVELWESRRGIIDTIQRRHLDLKFPAVAPHSADSTSLVRSDPCGCCPSCAGEGHVLIFDEDLVIADRHAKPTDETFLHPEAFTILRGIRRNTFLPFFKRMTVEGLWPDRKAFHQLTSSERRILMHGYWHRPGPGSFLKSSKDKPEEVSSWLRWDGLFRAVLAEAERSNASEWVDQLHATTFKTECPICLGTGLQLHSRAIYLGSQSFFDWVRKGTISGFVKALDQLTPASTRSKKMRKRILYCLVPLYQAMPRAPLHKPISDAKLLRKVFDRVVHSMTQLQVIG